MKKNDVSAFRCVSKMLLTEFKKHCEANGFRNYVYKTCDQPGVGEFPCMVETSTYNYLHICVYPNTILLKGNHAAMSFEYVKYIEELDKAGSGARYYAIVCRDISNGDAEQKFILCAS